MESQAAIGQIRQACKMIGAELMHIHPAIPGLGHKQTQDELYRIVFEITKQVEAIKKLMARLEKDDTPLL